MVSFRQLHCSTLARGGRNVQASRASRLVCEIVGLRNLLQTNAAAAQRHVRRYFRSNRPQLEGVLRLVYEEHGDHERRTVFRDDLAASVVPRIGDASAVGNVARLKLQSILDRVADQSAATVADRDLRLWLQAVQFAEHFAAAASVELAIACPPRGGAPAAPPKASPSPAISGPSWRRARSPGVP
jgi:hypothetical protein